MTHPPLTVYGAPWCGDCKRTKKFLGEQCIHYEWVDVEQNEEGLALVERVNEGKRIIPTVIFADGSMLVEPSNAQLAAKLGLQTKARLEYYDLIIVGGGPTGLTTALYAAREGLEVVVIERGGLGGQAAITEKLETSPVFPKGSAEPSSRIGSQSKRAALALSYSRHRRSAASAPRRSRAT